MKVVKIKKELETAELLFQIKQGFDPKKKKNLPNRLYLADLEVTAKDVYIKRDFANKTAETLDTSGHHEIGRRQENNKTANQNEIDCSIITLIWIQCFEDHVLIHNQIFVN